MPAHNTHITDHAPHVSNRRLTRSIQTIANWHLRLNHLLIRKLVDLKRTGAIPRLQIPKIPTNTRLNCSACNEGKQHELTHHIITHSAKNGEQISSGICGPCSTPSMYGNNYFATFIDTYSRYAMIAFLKKRSEVAKTILQIFEHIKNHEVAYPKIFRSENVKEYQSSFLFYHYAKLGISYITTVPYTPQEKSIAERFNRTILNIARDLSHSKLPPQYWEPAVGDALYKYNMTIQTVKRTLPFTDWQQRPPDVRRFFSFGQLGTIPSLTTLKKLESRCIPVPYL